MSLAHKPERSVVLISKNLGKPSVYHLPSGFITGLKWCTSIVLCLVTLGLIYYNYIIYNENEKVQQAIAGYHQELNYSSQLGVDIRQLNQSILEAIERTGKLEHPSEAARADTDPKEGTHEAK